MQNSQTCEFVYLDGFAPQLLPLSLALVNNLSLGILRAALSFTFLLNLISAEKREFYEWETLTSLVGLTLLITWHKARTKVV